MSASCARRPPACPDVGVCTLLLEGPPAKRIVERVREGRHDLVVMGSHGRGRLGSALLGSVSQQVVQHSPVPVLAIHGPREEPSPVGAAP
jgi:nucleotide-binding universal stress UspA family protein